MKKIYHGLLFIIQYCLYYLLTPLAYLLYGKKHPWIICERGDDARDNGYYMFKYLSSEHMYIHRYYLIDKHSADYPKIAKYGKIVKYKSFKHWLLYIAAECRMTTHLAAFAPGNYIGEYFKHHKQKGINVFLQHGITHNEFDSNYYIHNGSDLFICGAKPEYDYLSTHNGYPSTNIFYTGFARFDGLHDIETKDQILIMPSWRSYLRGLSKEDFKNSKYFKAWKELLTSDEFSHYRNSKMVMVFYIHYSLKEYIDCFNDLPLSNVILADFDHYDVQTLLKESKILITDYSSILFDYAYMRKPQVLYQFDVDEFYGKHYKRSYFDHARDGFGDVVTSLEELTSSIKRIIDNDCKLEDKYLSKIDNFFPIYDSSNCERIVQAIYSKYIEKKKKYKKCSNPPSIIVTGDDYGRNYESSEGIRQAFKKGYINHTSVMVNKDEKDNIDIKNIDIDKVGLHINLTEGYQSFGDTSIYAYSVNNPDSIARKEFNTRRAFFKLSEEAKQIIEKEVRGQIARYKELGFKCVYFDSHGHIHNKMPIAKIIIPILKEAGFTHARIPMNIKHDHLLFDLLYKTRVTRLYRKNFITTDYFCSCYDYIHIRNLNKYKGKTIEIMTHPYINKELGLVNRRDINFQIFENKK